MKIFNLVFAILFAFSAGLQYNDPDPYLWIPIYLYGAILCWFAFRGKYYSKAYLVGIAGYLVYAIYLVFIPDGVIDWVNEHHAEDLAATMESDKPWIEDAREFFGLLILIAVLLINYIYTKKKVKKVIQVK